LRAKFFSLVDWLFGGGFEEMDFGSGRSQGFDLEVRTDEMIVTAQVPGFTAEELSIELSGSVLTIRAERNLARTKAQGETLAGRTCRTVTQSLLLPAAGDRDEMKADYRNGVLTVHVPKRDMPQRQRLTAAR
jgi:HSP20 family protein